MRHISNSEVGTWLTCRKKYYFSFVRNLQPNHYGPALSKGQLGHEVLSIYYQRIKDGVGHDQAQSDAMDHLGYAMGGSDWNMDVIIAVRSILMNYFSDAEYAINDWEILEVEKDYDLYLNQDYTMPMRLDMLVKDKAGKIALVDHKFFYDMPNVDKLALNVQFPKYVGALRANGINVDYCVLNVLRTRSLKNPAFPDLFKRFPVTVSNHKVVTALSNHILASGQISEYRDLTPEMQEKVSLPLMNDYVCKGCDFAPLCISEFDGGNIEFQITQDYKSNTYGYNHTTEEGAL